PQRRPAIAPALDQHLQHLALVIDGAPEVHPLAGDPHHHLVEMPEIAWPRALPAQPARDRWTELQHPAPYRFVGDVEPALGQQFLHVPVARREAEIQPDRVLDDLGREAMAAVAERGHADTLPDTPLTPDPVSVTMPFREWRSPACSGCARAAAGCGGTGSAARAGSAFTEFFTPRQTSVYRPDATKRVGNKD